MGVARGGLNNRPIWPAERARFVVLHTPRKTRRCTPDLLQSSQNENPLAHSDGGLRERVYGADIWC